jgi:transcriptional regulator with XRE-family HTH domain
MMTRDGCKDFVEIDHQDLGKIMGDYRKKEGLTQKDLGDKLGISRDTVSKIERGLISDVAVNSYSSRFITLLLIKCMEKNQ